MIGGQVDQVEADWNQMQLVVVNPEVVVDNKQKHHRRMTDKGREYKKTVLNKMRTSPVLRITRKSSEIEDLLYSHQNEITVKEKLSQLSDILKLIEEINQEMTDDDYTEEFWFAEVDERIFFFKHKIHNWLKELTEEQKERRPLGHIQIYKFKGERNPRKYLNGRASSRSILYLTEKGHRVASRIFEIGGDGEGTSQSKNI